MVVIEPQYYLDIIFFSNSEISNMYSRERLIKTLNHVQPDRVVFDLGATAQTGISASTLYQLRKALGFEERMIQVQEPAQILGRVD